MNSLKKLSLILLSVLVMPLLYAQHEVTVTGTVTSSDGEALSGVCVIVEGTTTAVLTDAKGKYSVKANPGTKLIFNMLGFKDEIVDFGNKKVVNVTMNEDVTALEESVVVGYGTIKKKDLTGSVASINSEELKDYPATNFQEMLAGRAAGVETVAASGQPGAVAHVRIRGIGTVNGTSPLYVVDGVPLNRTIDLDPKSIETMQVLKDASATAIYGSRGSNGVILITTKKGKAGTINVDFDAFVGFSEQFIKYKQASSTQLYDFYVEQNKNDGTEVDYHVTNQYNKGVNTDWVDLCTRTGINQNYSLFVSGGSEKFKSSLTISYVDQLGTIKKSDLNKITLRNNNEYSPAPWLKIGSSIGVGYYKLHTSKASIDILLSADPFTTPINPLADPSDPNYEYNKYTPTGFSWNTNPLSLLSQSNAYETEFNPFGSAYVDVRILDGLYFKSQVAFEKENFETKSFEPYYKLVAGPDDVMWDSEKYRDFNKIYMGTRSNLYLNFEQTIRYDKTVNRHSINAIVGLTYEKWNNSNIAGQRTGLPSNDPIFWTLDAATGEDDVASGGMNESAIVSYLGRVNYSFDGRYMFTASFRADGSSEFAPGNRWGFFPSFSLGWDISQEKFFKSNVSKSLVSQLKLRAGWGATGNKSAAARSQILSLMGTGRGVDYAFGRDVAEPLIAVYPMSRGNSSLRWETGQQYNIGLDLEMFNSKMVVTADYYSKYTNDMILTMDLPAYAQFPSSPKANMGSMQNNGFEFSISYDDHIGDFTYGVTANISTFKSVVKSLGGNPEYWSGDFSKSIVGEEFGRFYMLEYLGIFQNQREIDMYTDANGRVIQPLAQPGDFKFADHDGDGQITDNDRVFMGTPQPDVTFGLSLSAGYKNFDLTLFFTGQFGNQIFNYPKGAYGKLQRNNITQDLYYNSWRKEGDVCKYPRITATDLNSNFRTSSWYLEDGSYVKLRNVSLGYNFPKPMMLKTKIIKGLRLYISGQNLFTLTKYTGFDPEVEFSGIEDFRRYIPGKQIIVGLNIQF